ncbi:MAG: mucin desulfatase, partial [bacterium]|nr:mucin desulfatase [bacterium]
MRKTPNIPPVDLRAISGAFPLHGCFVEGSAYGSGHINDTYAVLFDQAGAPVRYIFQRINDRIFRNVPALMDNIQRVTAHVGARVAAANAPEAA